MQIIDSEDYREYLHWQLGERRIRNPHYSLRAFARDLGISASMLSDVLNGHHSFSRATAKRIANSLRLDKQDTLFFCNLVDSHAKRNSAVTRAAKLRLTRDLEIKHRSVRKGLGKKSNNFAVHLSSEDRKIAEKMFLEFKNKLTRFLATEKDKDLTFSVKMKFFADRF